MSHSGAATYKKVAGIITIDEDMSPAEMTWRSTSGDKTHTIILDTIDKLQATPTTSEKMMLRLIGKPLGENNEDDPQKKQKNNEGEPVENTSIKPITHMLSFNNREVMDNIKITLQQIISRYKDQEIYDERRKHDQSLEAQTIVSVPLINTAQLDDSLSRGKLLVNLKLQQSLLRHDKLLMKAFQETVMNAGLSPEEFWSTRIPLLRTFALSTSQRVGPYNVLSTIKPVASSENKVNVNLSREKIVSIFQNYPIVKKAYDDNVPKNFKEQEFWARFFSSKLFRKLRGEKLMQSDRGDVIIDRYINLDQEYDRMEDEKLTHPVKKFIDIDGNEEDDPVKFGHRPHFTMRPGLDVNGNSDGTIDILKGMNRLSEKMVAALENEYSRAKLQGDSPDDEEKESLNITDLQPSYSSSYAIVHLKTKALNSQQHKDDDDNNSKKEDNMTPTIVTQDMIATNIKDVIDALSSDMDLSRILPDKETSIAVNKEVIYAVKINAKQAKHNNVDPILGTFVNNVLSETDAKSELPLELIESCRILHTTCCEFLKHFYIHFQSGDYKQATKVNKLYKHLKSCIEKLHELLSDVKKGDGEEIAATCTAYLKPTLNSITYAVERYDRAFNEVNKEAMASK
ncbi:similar to Saccharomyces cerevisiae YDR311W TFB1 Subunit of TFIIH and nucleotide excision repair factor 3 complexes, required for nucleotide excision repair, target for transcriptional activators [Maudiozyma barnettii]|nr:similar to Saccharomyces cerevisiae YDR311W TFB1 Subunit of TFIIH and nucleotide excision repair factor 3 complexes, required for nucleotide excision repair, target for transcriptional activators [Kazachstania barnettii]